jgi:4-hydroxy-tetrahydrodipicolinate reductase
MPSALPIASEAKSLRETVRGGNAVCANSTASASSVLAAKAAAVLHPEFDIELVEAHHNQKLDAPSGTALMIADRVNEALDHRLHYVYDRHAVRGKRDGNELGIHAIRGGSIVGEHTLLFAGPDEVIEIRHSAQSRDVFAHGALKAARFLVGKAPGLYSMKDLIAST